MAPPAINAEFTQLLDSFREACKTAKTLADYFAPADKRKPQLDLAGNAAVRPDFYRITGANN